MTDSPAYPLDPSLVMALAQEETEASAGVRGRLKKHWQSLYSTWHTSRQLRVLTLVAVILLVATVFIGWNVIGGVRSHIFDRTVATDLERYEGSYTSAQALLSTDDSLSEQEVQKIANQVISSQYDATHEVVGAVLLPSDDNSGTRTLEPSTETTAQLTALITEEFRKDVSTADEPRWRQVTLPATLQVDEDDADAKATTRDEAIIIGQVIEASGGEKYEFYIAYALNSENDIIASIRSSLIAGFVGLFAVFIISIYVVTRSVLQPVRNVARKAQQIADGDYDARMEVRGEDELAQLSRSFNRMATSIQDQFVRYERVANVQQGFVSAVSHELRSPVTTIRMAGQLMYDKREELPASLQRSVELQHEQLINLDTMLSDLLEISRYDAGAMELEAEETLVSAIVEKALADQIPLVEANGVEVQVVVEGDTTVEGDRRRIERIIRNLLVNALEHSEGKAVRVRTVGGESAVAVEVSDRGIGLSEEQAANVFKRFWRADSSRVRKSGGTGLGMTLAHEDAEFHGGTLECAGILGVGSTFLLTLPRTVGAEFEPPVQLKVAATEEEWDSDAGTTYVIEPEVDDVEASVEVTGDEDSPEVVIDSDAEGRPIQVSIPSAGVAVITRPDDEEN